MKNRQCIVVWDDGDHIFPMAFDKDCDGAVCGASEADPIAMFEDRKAAMKAIRISECYARLRKAQEKPYNGDFIDGPCHIKVRYLDPGK